jgi:hypothetical protein
MTLLRNIEDYGLTPQPDGFYADSALLAFIEESSSRATATPLGTFYGGLTLKVNGLYHLSSGGVLPINSRLFGSGRTTGFVCHGDGLTICDQGETNSDCDNTIGDLSLYSLSTDRVGISAIGGSGCRVHDVFFAGWEFGIDLLNSDCMAIERIGGGGASIGSVDATMIRIRGESNVNTIRDCRFNAWRGVLHEGGAQNRILSSNFNGPDIGVLVRGATSLTIEGNFEATMTAGILIDNPGTVAAGQLTVVNSFHGGGGGTNSAPLIRVTSGSVVYGLNLVCSLKQGGVYMVEHESGLDVAGAFFIGNRHYGSGPLIDKDAGAHESTFYASSAYNDETRSFTGIGTLKPQKTLDVWDGPVGLRLRDGTGVRLDLP